MSYVFLILLFKRPKLGLWLSALMIPVGMMWTGLVIHKYETRPFMNASVYDIKDMLTKEVRLHLAAYNYISSYFMGLILGWLVLKDIRLPRWMTRIIGFGVSPACIVWVYWVPHHWNSNEYSRTEEEIGRAHV